MASQTVVKTGRKATKPEAETPIPEAKKPRKAPKTFDYTRYRVTMQNTDDFQRYLAGYPNKAGLIAYVYRLVPKIDLSLIGKETTNILETTDFEKVTPAAIAEDFGRGKYMVTLNDANRAKGEREVCKSIYRLEDEAKPPVYDIRTLVLSHGDNIDEVNRQITAGALVRDTNGAPRVRTAEDQPTIDRVQVNGNVHSNGDLFSRETMSQVLLKMIDKGSQNPSDFMKQTIEVAKLLQPPPAAPIAVEQLAELVAAKLGRTAPAGGDGDFFGTYERVQSFIEKVRGPAVVSEGASGWLTLVSTLLERLDRWAPALIDSFRNSAPVAARQYPAARSGPPAAQPAVSVQEQIGQLAKLGFQKMQQGVNGLDFAAYVCMYMPGGHDIFMMLQPHGPLGVMGLAAMDQEMAPLMADAEKRDQIESFLSDFFSFDPSNPYGVSETDPAAGADTAAAGAAA